MSLTSKKTLAIAAGVGTVDFDTLGASALPERIDPRPITNFIDIAATTNFTAGTFSAYVEYVEDGGFAPVIVQGLTGNVINAVDVGSLAVVGDVKRWEFKGNPFRVRVVAAGILATPDEVTVIVSQAQGI